MSQDNGQSHRLTDEGVKDDLQRQPFVLMRLAENALTVAESLRTNYFPKTAEFIKDLRLAARRKDNPIVNISSIEGANWQSVQGEVVTFIDGGVGRVELSGQTPILLRVGSYAVRTGERNLAEREQFGYYPVILGDLEGGSKERADFIDIVRITAELLGGLSALKRNPDLKLLMFHGPLVYQVGRYTIGTDGGHTPFTENDINIFLRNYAINQDEAQELKQNFLAEAQKTIYPQMMPDRHFEMTRRRLFEPMAWMSFLYRELIREAKSRNPMPIIVGVVERGRLREFSETILLKRVFENLNEKGELDYFNKKFGRQDLTGPKNLLDRLMYTDSILLAMLLQPGQRTESWTVSKYGALRSGKITLNGESFRSEIDYGVLKNSATGFPNVQGCYFRVSEQTEPIRIETFTECGETCMEEAVKRAYLYSLLLPGYGFPVGLDVADKFAKIPNWLTNAYSKLIRHHLSTSLQRGEINDVEMRHLIVQAMYMNHRDWLFRPTP